MTEPTTPTGDAEHEYHATATTTGTGVSNIRTRQTVVLFDSSPRQGDELPGPADLRTASFAACMIKSVERMGELLPHPDRLPDAPADHRTPAPFKATAPAAGRGGGEGLATPARRR